MRETRSPTLRWHSDITESFGEWRTTQELLAISIMEDLSFTILAVILAPKSLLSRPSQPQQLYLMGHILHLYRICSCWLVNMNLAAVFIKVSHAIRADRSVRTINFLWFSSPSVKFATSLVSASFASPPPNAPSTKSKQISLFFLSSRPARSFGHPPGLRCLHLPCFHFYFHCQWRQLSMRRTPWFWGSHQMCRPISLSILRIFLCQSTKRNRTRWTRLQKLWNL